MKIAAFSVRQDEKQYFDTFVKCIQGGITD